MTRSLARSSGMPPGALSAVLVPYVVSRVIVVTALAVTRHVVTTLAVTPKPIQVRQGLLAWDAAFYRDIAEGGYDNVARPGLRFFPLLALVARPLTWLPGVSAGAAVVVVANVSALAAGLLLYRLVWRERHDEELARRAVWLVYLVPPAFVLVMGYAEALLMVWTIVALMALRNRRWWLAALVGVLAGLTRPVGALLVVPALVEVLRDRRHVGRREWVARAAAVLGSAAGVGAYLIWVGARYGDGLYPLRVQQEATRRGGWTDPVQAVYNAARDVGSGDRVSAGIHLVTVAVLVLLVVVLARRWPLSFTLYAVAALVLGLSSRNLDSLERYSLSAVPFVLAAADVVDPRPRERVVLMLAGAGLMVGAILAFTGVLVP